MNQLKFRDASQQDLPRIVEIYNSTIASRMSQQTLHLYLLPVDKNGLTNITLRKDPYGWWKIKIIRYLAG